MNEYRESRSAPDWWSRCIALGSLLIASAALYYSYLNEKFPLSQATDPATLAKTDTQTQRTEPLSTDSTSRPGVPNPGQDSLASPNRPLDSNELDSADSNSAKPIDWQSLKVATPDSATPQDDGLTALADKSDSASVPQTGDDVSNVDGRIQTDLGNNLLEKSYASPLGRPLLATVRQMLKPVSDGDHVTALIKNRGDGIASIQELIFSPQNVEVVPEDSARRVTWGPGDDQHLIVRFGETDNHTSTRGRHGDYIRELQVPFVIDPDGSAELKLVLENSDHIGYGLVGKLTLRLADGDEFVIDQVAIPFVEP